MKVFGASALLIALLSVTEPVGAHSDWFGTLAADQPYTINVDNAANSQGKTVVTIYYHIGGRPATAEQEPQLGTKTKFDVLTVAARARELFLQLIPRDTRAIIIHVAPPANGTVIVDVRQGSSLFSDTCVGGGCSKVLDIQ